MCFAYKPYNKACLGCAKSQSSYSKAMTPFHATLRTCPSSYNRSYSAHSNFLCKVCVSVNYRSEFQSYGDVRKLSFLRLLKGCLKLRVAFVEFMFMGQCGSLVLERFSAAIL